MSMKAKRVIWRFVIFALMGMLAEVFFGASGAVARGNWNMHGHSSPWMMFDYGLLGIALMPVARPLIRLGIPLALRAAVYMAAIFFVEFVTGWLFDLCGLTIWDYTHMPYNLCGYITLLYAPIWYALGLVAEFLYRKVDALAMTLSLGLSAERLEAMGQADTGSE